MFRQIETTTFPDREPEIYVTLVAIADEPTDEAWSDEKYYTVHFEPITKDDVTLDDLLNAVNQAIESENHHSISDFPNFLIDQMVAVIGEEQAKTILWNMIERKGFLLGL